MGIALMPYGNTVEIGAKHYNYLQFNTVAIAEQFVCRFTIPTRAQLYGGAIQSAYCDMIVGRYRNTRVGANWLDPNSYLAMVDVDTGTHYHTVYTDFSIGAYCTAAGTYPGHRVYGDTDMGNDYLQYGKQYDLMVMEGQAAFADLYLEDLTGVLRLVVH